jgi:Raf kinase inhibitor-like YbhB/YbcL family protein
VKILVLALAAVLVVAGCGGGGRRTSLEDGPTVAGFGFTAESDVSEGAPIDARLTCDGENVSPALAWKGVPEGAAELALAVEDPDAQDGTFTHWLVYGIDPSMTELPGGDSSEGLTGYEPMFRQGDNDFGDAGYGGPCPPGGSEHRYVFRLFALHAAVELEEGADRSEFDEIVAPHVLAEARLTARYARE